MVEDLIFDIGLHKGEDTDFYLRKGYKVVAFEANPQLVAHCAKRFRAPLEQGRLQIVAGAITSETGATPVLFYDNQSLTEWGTIAPGWAERNRKLGTQSIPVEVGRVNVTDSFRQFGVPYYAKIDIEGSDRVVLQSLRELSDRPYYVSIESEKVNFENLREELKMLSALGYSRFRPVQQATIPGSCIHTRDLACQEFDYVFEASASGPFGDDLALPWLNYRECLDEYKKIFWFYRLFGDRSLLQRTRRGREVLSALQRRSSRPLPGWYDTHAALA